MLKSKHILAFALTLVLALTPITGCQGSPSSSNAYDKIMNSENIGISEARELLSAEKEETPEFRELSNTLDSLATCQGRYLQKGPKSDKVYTADVSFYLSEGKIMCHLTYTGYSGELSDGPVTPCSDSPYLFESHPKGTFHEREHDFTIKFGSDSLYVSWSKSEYILTREEGAAGEDEDTPFLKSELFKSLKEKLDELLAATDYSYRFDDATSTFTLYIEAPQDTRSFLESKDTDALSRWSKLVSSMTNLGESVYEIVHMGYDRRAANHMDLFVVDKLNVSNNYSKGDYLLKVSDGALIYDFASTLGFSAGKSYNSDPSNNSSSGSSKPSSSYSAPSATSGQRNALSKAKEYLNAMAFSKQGLHEQLQYEGFSDSEAQYGVDNCEADWNKQAVKKAREYLSVMSFSRNGLVEQLVFEGFTPSQADSGVDKAY